jgi:glutaredoxin-like protein
LGNRLVDGKRAKLLTFSTKQDNPRCEYCDEVRLLAEELASVSAGRIIAEHHTLEEAADLAKRLRVKRAPATVVTDAAGELAMKFYGLPSGYEFAALLEDLVDAAVRTPSGLSEQTLQSLRKITTPAHIQVFVTPSCPYCPRAVRIAHQFSLANPKMIDAEMVESMEFPELAEKYAVMAVPKVVINDRVQFEGALPEKIFLYKLIEAVGEG